LNNAVGVQRVWPEPFAESGVGNQRVRFRWPGGISYSNAVSVPRTGVCGESRAVYAVGIGFRLDSGWVVQPSTACNAGRDQPPQPLRCATYRGSDFVETAAHYALRFRGADYHTRPEGTCHAQQSFYSLNLYLFCLAFSKSYSHSLRTVSETHTALWNQYISR
jgi:hypothetical protein